MSWIKGNVDGVEIEMRSGYGTSEWLASFERMMEYEGELLADREDMAIGFCEPFNDSDDVTMTNGTWSVGCVQNTVAPAVVGESLVPVLTSDSGDDVWEVFGDTYSSLYPVYKAFDGVKDTADDYNIWCSALDTNPHYIGAHKKSGETIRVSGVTWSNETRGGTNGGVPTYWCYPKDIEVQVSDDGVTWVTIKSFEGIIDWTPTTVKTFLLDSVVECKYIRAYVTDVYNSSVGQVYCAAFEILGEETSEHSEETTILMNSYEPQEDVNAAKVKLWIESLDNQENVLCGNGESDTVQAFLSCDNNSTFESAIEFEAEAKPTYLGSNIYIFTSNEIDLSQQEVAGIGLKVQSFDRGSSAPNFKLHGALVVCK